MRRLAAAVGGVVVALLPLSIPATPATAATPTIHGVLLNEAGGPASAAFAVQATRHQNFFDVFADLVGFGLGGPEGLLACLGPNGICEQPGTVTVRVRRNGSFSLTPSKGAGDYDITVLSLTGRTPQARVTFRATVAPSGLTLPTMRLWDSPIHVTKSPGTIAFSWSSMPAAPGYVPNGQAIYQLSMKPLRRNGFPGTPVVIDTTATVDDRQLEDTPGAAVAIAMGRLGSVKVSWLTRPARYPAPAGRPLSRGHSCTVTVQGAATPARFTPCWLDNGKSGDTYGGARSTVCYQDDPNSPLPETECGKRPVTAVTIDLGASRPIAEVRGAVCERCLVDVSASGRTWSRPIATSHNPGSVVDLPAGTVGRYIRLRAASPVVGYLDIEYQPIAPVRGPIPITDGEPNDLALVSEFSVWAPRPAPPPTPSPAVTASASPTAFGGISFVHRHSHGSDSAPAVIAIAAVLAAGLAAAIGFLALRRTG